MRDITIWNDNFATPWRGLMDVQRNLDRLFDQVWSASTDENSAGFVHPACDVEETDSHYVMSVDLPGLNKKDINIEVKDNQLIVSGERKNERKGKGTSERYYGRFHRIMTLPTHVDAEKIEAQYQDGVLSIALPKAESAKARQIKISEGKSSLFGRFLGKNEPVEKEQKDVTKTQAA